MSRKFRSFINFYLDVDTVSIFSNILVKICHFFWFQVIWLPYCYIMAYLGSKYRRVMCLWKLGVFLLRKLWFSSASHVVSCYAQGGSTEYDNCTWCWFKKLVYELHFQQGRELTYWLPNIIISKFSGTERDNEPSMNTLGPRKDLQGLLGSQSVNSFQDCLQVRYIQTKFDH